MKISHVVGEPSILYLGTPVVLISTENEDGSANLGPMSSAKYRKVKGASVIFSRPW